MGQKVFFFFITKKWENLKKILRILDCGIVGDFLFWMVPSG